MQKTKSIVLTITVDTDQETISIQGQSLGGVVILQKDMNLNGNIDAAVSSMVSFLFDSDDQGVPSRDYL